jgi:hypothetical protein
MLFEAKQTVLLPVPDQRLPTGEEPIDVTRVVRRGGRQREREREKVREMRGPDWAIILDVAK